MFLSPGCYIVLAIYCGCLDVSPALPLYIFRATRREDDLMEYFEEEKVRRFLRIEDLIPAMRQVLAEFSAGKWQQPLRGVLAQHGGFFGVMPASGEFDGNQDGDFLSR